MNGKFCGRYLSIFYVYSWHEWVNSVLNVKVLVGAFNQEKAIVAAFSVIVKSSRNLLEPSFQALVTVPRY